MTEISMRRGREGLIPRKTFQGENNECLPYVITLQLNALTFIVQLDFRKSTCEIRDMSRSLKGILY